MTSPTALHQLGLFVVRFQDVEALLNEVIGLIASSDEESVSILTNDMEFSQRLKAADVLFARFLGLNSVDDEAAQSEFHQVMVSLRNAAERRNELVHSRYHHWYDVAGKSGLLRKHSRLHGKAGKREETEEEMQPEAFNTDLSSLEGVTNALENQRLKIINWRYPGP